MVNQTLEDAYKKISERKRKYDEAARLTNSLSDLAVTIFYLSFIILIVLRIFFGDRISRSYTEGVFVGGILFAVAIIVVVIMLRKKIPSHLNISPSQIEFLEAFYALKELEQSLKNEDELEISRSETARIISKIEKDLTPGSKRKNLRRALTKEISDKLNLLRLNLNEKIIPIIKNGELDDVKKTYSKIEDLAHYFLKPSFSNLESLNTSINELPSINIEKKEPSLAFFEQYPYFLHIVVFLSIIFLGSVTYYLGINSFNVSKDNAFIAAVALIGTLSAGYIGRMKGRQNTGELPPL